MFDWVSAAIGAASSLVVSLFVAIFAFQYQNWKSDVQKHISLFYQARSQIIRNEKLLSSYWIWPDKRKMLIEKVQLLPCYPFTDFDIIDQLIRTEFELYDDALILAMTTDYAEELKKQPQKIADTATRIADTEMEVAGTAAEIADTAAEIADTATEIANHATEIANHAKTFFEGRSSHVLSILDIMIQIWDTNLKKHMLLYFLLPFLLRKQSEQIVHEHQKVKDDRPIQNE